MAKRAAKTKAAPAAKGAKPAARANFPLADVGGSGDGAVKVGGARAKITLRGKPDNAEFMSAAQKVLGFALPVKVGATVSASDGKTAAGSDSKTAAASGVAKTAAASGAKVHGVTALCLGPDEWMLWAADSAREPLLARLQESLSGIFSAVVDVSDYYAIIELSGENAADILASGCPLDLSQMRPGDCAQTHHEQSQILILQTGNAAESGTASASAPSYDIQIRISVAPHLHRALQTAAH